MARHAVVVDQPEDRDERIQQQELDQRLRHGALLANICCSAPPYRDREYYYYADKRGDEPSVIAGECSCRKGDAAGFERNGGTSSRRPDWDIEIRKAIAEKIIQIDERPYEEGQKNWLVHRRALH